MPSIRMTARTLESIKPTAGKQVDYFDSATPGLHLRVSPKGAKSWAYFYRVQTLNGRKQRRFTIGRFPALSLADARDQAREKYHAIQTENADPAADRVREIQVVTMTDMADAYIQKHAKVNKRSWQEDERNLRVNVLPLIGALHPREVERHHIEQILDRIAARGATVMQNRVFALLSAMFNWGVGVYLDIPPTYGMKKRVREKPRERCLSTEEIKIIWKALSVQKIGKSGRRLYVSEPVSLILKLLLVTAQRSSEVSQSKTTEYDLVKKIWTIPAERSKNGRSHRVPLSELASQLVEQAMALKGNSHYLFPSVGVSKLQNKEDSPVNPTAANNALRKIVESSGLENITPHDFRETAATGMMFLGIPEPHVGAVLNHTKTSVTARHYARHQYENEKLNALGAWSDHLSILING